MPVRLQHCLTLLCLAMFAKAADLGPPPKAERIPVRETIHGVTITDNYRWLEDQNSPKTRAWIAAQQKYAAQFFATLPERSRIRTELDDLERVENRTLPHVANGRYFFTQRLPHEEQGSIYMQEGATGQPRILVNANNVSADHSVSASIADVSRDGRLLVYELRKGGQDETEIHVLGVEKNVELPDGLPRARYDAVSMMPDNSAYYYSKLVAGGTRAFRHQMGTPTASDREIFGARYGPEYISYCHVTVTGHYLVCIALRGAATVDADFYEMKIGRDRDPKLIAQHVPALSAVTCGDRLYILSAANAPNHKVMAIELPKAAAGEWREIVPEGKAAITGIHVSAKRLYLTRVENVAERLYAYSSDGKPAGEIHMPTAGSLDGVSGQEDGSDTFFGFSSFAYPDRIFRLSQSNVATRWWQSGISLDPKQVELKQVWYASKDGTKVPMYIVRKKGMVGPRPTLMTAYGGFDISVLPSWSPTAAWWVEQGGVFAQPSLRGGGEFGEAWHRAGMLANKQNVFDDFFAAAECLIHQGITTPGQLAISGTSNGGLLMGVAITQHPELFRAVICGAPLLDMLRYQNFRIAKLWVPEYGSSDDPAQFQTLLKYSPYQHVKQGVNYPAILFWSGDGDTRVDPLHARKMTALMQADAAPGRPIILRYDTLTGHSGGRSVDQQLDFDADKLSFAASEVGLAGA